MGMDAEAARQKSPEEYVGLTLGTCTLERILGRGGMGVVYLAQQSRPHRQVAVKLLMLSLMPDSERRERFLKRFRREADAVAALEHPNILPIFEYGEQTDLAYLVMPYVSGGTLRDRVVRKGPLPFAEVSGFLAQAANALDYAHQHGVIHRDVKPQNMLLYPDKRLVLSDFGIAKVAQAAAEEDGGKPADLTTMGRVVGTPDYIAPEQAMGHEVDARADIYSLGVVLFYMVTGQVPFVGPQPMAIAAKHVSEPPPPPRQFRLDLPVAAEGVILRALAKDPAARYRSAGELSRAFRAAFPALTIPVSGQPALAHPTVRPGPPVAAPLGKRTEKRPERVAPVGVDGDGKESPPRPSRRWLAVLVALLVIALAVGGAYAARTIKQTQPAVVATHTALPTSNPTSTNTPSPTPTNTPSPSPTSTNTPIPLYEAEQFVPQVGDLPAGTTALAPVIATTPQEFQQSNPGRIVDPTSGFNWVKDILVTIDQGGSQYLIVAIDKFASPADAHNYFTMVAPHLVQTAQQQFGDEEIDGICCDTNPTDYNILFRERNVTVLILAVSSTQQATQDGLSLAKSLDQHMRPRAQLLVAAATEQTPQRQHFPTRLF